jgi:hypothetical protein
MGTAKRIGRLGVLAAGLAIGAAMAATPGIASATTDMSNSLNGVDVFNAADTAQAISGLGDTVGLGAAGAAAPATTDIDISINGMDIFNGGGSATATSGMGDVAIAFGPNSVAFAGGGFGDFASALSTGSFGALAIAGDEASGAAGNNFDLATAQGNSSYAYAGNPWGSLPDTTPSSFDFASAAGGNSGVFAPSVAAAGFNGSNDVATAVGPHTYAEAGYSPNAAGPGNWDSASVLGNPFTPTGDLTEALAGHGWGLSGGSYDTAFINDLFGSIGSTAFAGAGIAGTDQNFDLAGVLGDNLNAVANNADFLAHILPFF